MSSFAFRFAGQDFVARPSGTLWWPTENTLIVADLHLGRSERMARRGGALLPPYEVRATLERLAAELAATGARRLIALGDSFDDDMARAGLGAGLGDGPGDGSGEGPGDGARMLAAIAARYDVLWISGNHDPGAAQAEAVQHGITFRHIAGTGPDISGHYHPKLRIAGRRVPVFLIGGGHVILPAFGTYTGGLDADAPALRALVPDGLAVLTGRVARLVPLARRRGA